MLHNHVAFWVFPVLRAHWDSDGDCKGLPRGNWLHVQGVTDSSWPTVTGKALLQMHLLQLITTLWAIYICVLIRNRNVTRTGKIWGMIWRPPEYHQSLVLVCTFRHKVKKDPMCLSFYLEALYSPPLLSSVHHTLPCFTSPPCVVGNRTRPGPDPSAVLPHDPKEGAHRHTYLRGHSE